MHDFARYSSTTTISSAMIMAAGLGTRLRPFTYDTPKPLLPLLGVPMLQFAMDALSWSGMPIRRLVMNHSHLSKELRVGAEQLSYGKMELSLSDESDLLLGGAGGLRKALPTLGLSSPFFVMNADVLCALDLAALADTHFRLRAAYGTTLTMAIHRKSPGKGAYRTIHTEPTFQCGSNSGLIRRLGTPLQATPFYSGVAVIEPEAISHLPEGRELEFVPEILERAITAGTAGAHLFEGEWMDIGSPELWLDAHLDLIKKLETGQLPELWRKRIELASVRTAEGVWEARSNQVWSGAPPVMTPSAYFQGSHADAKAWLQIGPNAVVYGSPPPGQSSITHGITWHGRSWTRPTSAGAS